MQIGILLSDIPFARDAALQEAVRLGVIPFEGDALDPSACMTITDFLARRNAVLELVAQAENAADAFICDADGAGHPTALGQGISDLDSYIQALLEKGTERIIIRNVRGTRQLEESVRFLKEKIAAYMC